MLSGMPNYRADLYAAGGAFRRTERFDATNPVAAVEHSRRLLAAHGADHAVLYATDGQGGTQHIARVEVAR